MPRVFCPWDIITPFVTDAFIGYGIPEEDAKICTDVLLESDKRGIESHGCNRFKPIYLDRIKAGIQQPVTNFEIVKETETTAVVDGHDGMGQVIGYKSMQMAIDKAKKYGMGMVVVRNSCHYGIAGYYASQAAKQGCIGITGTNARPSVAPTWGVDGMFGTNPLTIGIPTDEDFDFVIDCATSITQNGKIEYYERIGENVHKGTVITRDGEEFCGDAGEGLKMIRQGTAALTTLGGAGEALGGYKGYGYAMVVELLSAILQDGNYGKMLDGKDENGNLVAKSARPAWVTSSSPSTPTTSLAKNLPERKPAKSFAPSVTPPRLRVPSASTPPTKKSGTSGFTEKTRVFRSPSPFRKRSSLSVTSLA